MSLKDLKINDYVICTNSVLYKNTSIGHVSKNDILKVYKIKGDKIWFSKKKDITYWMTITYNDIFFYKHFKKINILSDKIKVIKELLDA
jgi:hypothetical protein